MLGALQGAVGWWMVASGLADRVEVSQYRLAMHLTLACVIYAAHRSGRRSGLASAPRRRDAAGAHSRDGAVALLVLVLVQIYLGALVAGLRAGYVYNTWPLIDGAFVPDAARLLLRYAAVAQFLRKHADGAVRSSHAGLRDLWSLALLHAIDALRDGGDGPAASPARCVLAARASLQAALGIVDAAAGRCRSRSRCCIRRWRCWC